MGLLDVLFTRWYIFMELLLTFVCFYFAGQLLFKHKKDLSIKLLEKFDAGRKKTVKIIYSNINKPYGILRVILIIFLVNLMGGAFMWSSIGGVFIIIPFINIAIAGLVTSLSLKKYTERVHWLAVPNIIFEILAFICAAIGGINIGLTILTSGNVYIAIGSWFQQFIMIVIPLQIIAAVFEGFLFYNIHIVRNNPWPYGISNN